MEIEIKYLPSDREDFIRYLKEQIKILEAYATNRR